MFSLVVMPVRHRPQLLLIAEASDAKPISHAQTQVPVALCWQTYSALSVVLDGSGGFYLECGDSRQVVG